MTIVPKQSWRHPSAFGVACGIAAAAFLLLAPPVSAQSTLDIIGVTQLRAVNPALTGAGVSVAQPEAQLTGNNDWEVNPVTVGQPNSLFTYTSTLGTASGSNSFPNSVGVESSHADSVAASFYGVGTGVAPGVAAVANYEANYFLSNVIGSLTPINATVINQSFVAVGNTPAQEAQLNQAYDTYAITYNKLFVSGVGNGGSVLSPATMYNGIGVAAYGGASSTGPTTDDGAGRSKPDITAPAPETSFSTPLVAGAATLLFQAGATLGASATDATDARTVKALLLDGAVRPADWTQPSGGGVLDTRYGAGIVNVYDSYLQLIGGEHHFTTNTLTTSLGASHLPPVVSGNVGTLSGWDFNTITSNTTQDSLNHYFIQLPASTEPYSFKGTIVWDRQAGQANINNLDLYLYNTATNSLVASSVSTVDNIQQLFVASLLPGTYDLEVLKNGGVSGVTSGVVSNSETYSLAFVAVPEPSGLALAMLGPGLLFFWGISRRAGRQRDQGNSEPKVQRRSSSVKGRIGAFGWRPLSSDILRRTDHSLKEPPANAASAAWLLIAL